ncbi:MAG: SAM-dependent methyltransferase [Treponema sp.]|nr:SAM-dependent methyltransferase [Treponema sp.]
MKLMEILLDKKQKKIVFTQFLELFNNKLDEDFFHYYFQNEAAERNKMKQDFTPISVSGLVAELINESGTYFEAAAGTGGMLIAQWKRNKDINNTYICEELSDRALPFLLLNMAFRGINGVVIQCDCITRETKKIYLLQNIRNSIFSDIKEISNYNACTYNAVMMNPPFSANWSAEDKFLSDPRFESFGKLAPKSKADFAFLLHGFYNLNEKGTMGIVLPHGVLFRGASEGIIRKTLLEMGAIDAVISLPSNLFYGTSIPIVVLILKKNRSKRDVLFIDASKGFEKQKNQNNLRQEDIKKIVDTYKNRKSIPQYAHLASHDEIVSNDYNLNIPRYVDSFEGEEQIDIVTLCKEITNLNLQIKQNEKEFKNLLDKLNKTDKTRELINATKQVFEKGVVYNVK